MEKTRFELEYLLLRQAARSLPTLQVGLLVQLYSVDSFKLGTDDFKVVSTAKVHRELGHPRRTVGESLLALADLGYIHHKLVSGEVQRRFSSSVRLLNDKEITQILGLLVQEEGK